MSDDNTGKVSIANTVVNTRTGFKIVTTEEYEVRLVKESGSWKIDDYKLISSKTE